MGFLDNSTVTVDAILTKKGRELLANGGDLNITKFALSDEEIDYTLWDVTHPNGTDSYGTVIENMSLLEATPNRTNFRSFLVDQSLAGVQLKVDQTTYTDVDPNTPITITPSTEGETESYTYYIENTNVVEFESGGGQSVKAGAAVSLKTKGINKAATTTVTAVGNTTGLTKVITVAVKADPTSNVDAQGPKKPEGRRGDRKPPRRSSGGY
jgi:hypothetical protein|tara:strand:+ start:2227 stop:2859 length:633 start_codon:yes stop_codon:yes gene_type:complete